MFDRLQVWLDDITGAIRKDIKTDYLPGTPEFCRKYFGNRPYSRVTFEEIQEAFRKELMSGNGEIGEWVVNRWVFQHGDVYTHFAEKMMGISPEFDKVKEFSAAESEQILKGAAERFGAKEVYLFSVLNQVVFPKAVIEKLRVAAENEKTAQHTASVSEQQTNDLTKLIERHTREINRMNEKYEQKIAGVLKKYTTDVEALKSQIRALQKQLVAK